MNNEQATFKLYIGKSSAIQPQKAVSEAIKMALQTCTDPSFGLVFSTDQYDSEEIAAAFNKELDGIPWAGCNSAGVFANNEFLWRGVVIGLISSSDLKVSVGVSPLNGTNSRQAGAEAVAAALQQLAMDYTEMTHRSLIVFADAKVGNVAEVIRGAVQEAGLVNTWAGGGVGNVLSNSKAIEFAHGQAYAEHVVVIALDSTQPTTTGIDHGWHPYGVPAMVTRSHGSVIEQLEYHEAFEVYRKTAADRGQQVGYQDFNHFAMTHPLGIPQADGNYVIRDPIGVESNGSLKFIAEVPDGCLVRMMEGTASELLKAAQIAAEKSKNLKNEPPSGAFIFDCISRYILLNQGYKAELDTFQKSLGSSVPFIGCLTFGEVGAFGEGIPQFHNKTAVVMTFYG